MDVLKKILKAYTDEEITPESRLIEDLGLDSFLVIYVLSEVEDAFDTRIEDYSSIVTVGIFWTASKWKKRVHEGNVSHFFHILIIIPSQISCILLPVTRCQTFL